MEACTREPSEFLIGGESGKGGIILVDVPGIGEDPGRQKEYIELYKNLVPKLDLILWAIKADDRSYASALEAYQSIFANTKEIPIIFTITQTDKISDMSDWNNDYYKPGESQIKNITNKENDISRRFDTSTKNVISIAVHKDGRSYNLKSLVDLIVETLPNEKKYSFTREAKEENISQEAREKAEKGIWDSVKEIAGDLWEGVKDKTVDLIIASAPQLLAKGKDILLNWLKTRSV